MEELVTLNEFKQASGIKKNKLAQFTFRAMKLNEVNKIYSNIPTQSPLEYVTALLNHLNIEIEVSEESLNNIPLEKGFITISNHPYGGIDGIILLYLILKKRPDYLLMANHILQKITPLKDVFIPVNSLGDLSDTSSFSGLRTAIKSLSNDNPVGFFPAGEVSTWSKDKRKVSDKPWSKSIIRIIEKAEKPIVPIYFEGGNSRLFYRLAALHPLLQTAKLPSEFTNKKDTKIKVIIGKPIKITEQKSFTKTEKFSKYLRTRTYCLGTDIEHKKFYQISLPKTNRENIPIAALEDSKIIAKKIAELRFSHLLFSSGKFDVFCAKAEQLGIILDEIGKLREITFRKVGEGTGMAKDMDEFDIYYHHMFIWDNENQAIVGAYRLGDGASILRQYGKHGFYISNLFRWKEPFDQIMQHSLELGRSFVQPEYQKKPQSLFLLWKGILFFLLKNNQYRYLIGPVSISGDYSSLSKFLIIKYIQTNYYDKENARYIKARKKFRYKNTDADVNIDDFGAEDIGRLENIIENIEPNQFKLPILIKKYLKQNAKFIGFNLDPAFNNCLDGLILLDLHNMDKTTLENLTKEITDIKVPERIENSTLSK